MDGWNWCCHITDFQYIHAWKQEGIIISICDISLLQFLFCKNCSRKMFCSKFERMREYNCSFVIIHFLWKKGWLQVLVQRNTVPLKILNHCKWFSDIMTLTLKCMFASALLKWQYALNWNICQIHGIYSIHGCKCSFKKYRVHWGMVSRNYFCETKKHSNLENTLLFD